jgi:hypothetical protein
MQSTKKMALYIPQRPVHCSANYGHLSLYFVEIDERGRIGGPSTLDGFETGRFADLVISCQWSEDRHDEPTYGHQTFYRDVYRVEARDAARMAKMFKIIEKVESNFPVHPASFGQYVALLCAGLGVNEVRQDVTEGSHSSFADSSYENREHRHFPIKSAQGVIDAMIAKQRKVEVSQ